MKKKKIVQFEDKVECERCEYFYPEEEMDWIRMDEGDKWFVCRNCEEEIKETNR